MQVMNNSQGPRGLNVRVAGVKTHDGKPVHETIVLQPGESRDVDLADQNCRVFAGMVRSRELLVEQPEAAGPAPVVKNEDGQPMVFNDKPAEGGEAPADKGDKKK